MSKKDKEEKFKDLWKQFLKESIKDPKDMEKEMIKETKEQLLKVIEQIETADDFQCEVIDTKNGNQPVYNCWSGLQEEWRKRNE